MIFMGIDPGSVICGYGVIEKTGKDTFKVLEYGVVEARKHYESMPQRLGTQFANDLVPLEGPRGSTSYFAGFDDDAY